MGGVDDGDGLEGPEAGDAVALVEAVGVLEVGGGDDGGGYGEEVGG